MPYEHLVEEIVKVPRCGSLEVPRRLDGRRGQPGQPRSTWRDDQANRELRQEAVGVRNKAGFFSPVLLGYPNWFVEQAAQEDGFCKGCKGGLCTVDTV